MQDIILHANLVQARENTTDPFYFIQYLSLSQVLPASFIKYFCKVIFPYSWYLSENRVYTTIVSLV